MRKKGIEVGINFFVILIISLVVFIFAMTFAFRFFTKSEEYRQQVDQNTRAEIENLVISQGNKVAVYPSQAELYRSQNEVIGVGIINTFEETATFTMEITCRDIQTGLNTCVDADDRGIKVVYQTTPITLSPNADEIESVVIQNTGAARGTYVVTVRVISNSQPYGTAQKIYVQSK